MKKILRQAAGFIGLSGIGWLLDFTAYIILGFVASNPERNNWISSWIGVTFVFIFATRKIFRNHSRISLEWKYLIYLIYQFLLILVISRVLQAVNLFLLAHISLDGMRRFSPVFAKILVTPVTMTVNFLVMKGIIEKI